MLALTTAINFDRANMHECSVSWWLVKVLVEKLVTKGGEGSIIYYLLEYFHRPEIRYRMDRSKTNKHINTTRNNILK